MADSMSELNSDEYELSTIHESVTSDSHTGSSSSLPEYPPYATTDMLGRYIPEADPDHPRAISLLRKLSKRATMLRIQLGLAASVAILNTVVWIWATATHHLDHRGVGTLFTGDCTTTSTTNSLVHLLLNGLSTLFLGTGNYCMQILVAPSRADLDSAHSSGDWLEVGVLSFRNIFRLRPRRLVLWLALGAISTVLHLVWNSTVFASLPFTIFVGAITTSDFQWATDNWNASTTQGSIRPMNSTDHERIYDLQGRARNFTWLDKLSCLKLYVDPLNTTSDVILVAKNLTSAQNNGSSLVQGWINGLTSWDYANFWVCGGAQKDHAHQNDYCTLDWALSLASNWTIATWEAPHYQEVEIDYCLIGGQADNKQRCGFHFSAPAMSAVSICTLIGCVLIFLVGRTQKEHLMVTLGDAISTFLENPEPLPSDEVTIDDRRLHASFLKRIISGRTNTIVSPKPAPWSPYSSISWFHAMSRQRWLVSYTFFLAGFAPVVFCLIYVLISLSNQGISISPSELWKQGLGQPKGFALIQGPWRVGSSFSDFAQQVLFTNGLQLLVSCAYMVFNNILSRQLVADEWVRLLTPEEKKPLRVSQPRGLQRSTYMLSMPFKYSVPTMVLFIALHWLVSQAIFLVQTTVYQSGPASSRVPEKDNSRIGFSAIGILLVVAMLMLLILGLLVHSAVRKYRDVPFGFPRLGTCSAGISAVCHAPTGDRDAHLFPVRMGVVTKGQVLGPGDDADWLIMSTYIGLQAPQRGSVIVQPLEEKLRKHDIVRASGDLDEEGLLAERQRHSLR
ncbi:hypothetical protein CNMCM7691_005706 [Aspergillus felis]|uniref:DUF6536 domain-containing protein n=1 Tax=Aspergillus felis TaxID=1287682 RepID=A0A8H6QRF0_9EURO|nr:hypothetical protein CNMCM7691_005706 [Aspergillus felis]